MKEFFEAYKAGNATEAEKEIGDVLFAAVNVGRKAGCDCEKALKEATERFAARFTKAESLALADGKVVTETNHAGGLNSGITNGMPLIVRVALRPTPSITRAQDTVDLETMTNASISSVGRFDPCLAPRTIPAAEAVLAFCILDAMEDR